MKYLFNVISNFSIKQKLILLSMVNSAIAVIITCTGFAIFNIVEERQDITEEISLVSKILSFELSGKLFKNKSSQATSVLSLLNSRPAINKACMYTNDDVEFAKYARKDLTKEESDCSTIPKINGKYSFIKKNKFNMLKDEKLITASDIIYDDIKIGSLYIETSMNNINNKINSFLKNSIILFYLMLFISYFISKFLQKNFSDPIIHLADIAQLVKNGNYKIRARFFYHDEVGELTTSFNNMLEEIQNSKEDLENKVRMRTLDLTKALQVKSEFLSNISHEIRTPIHGIMNYADFLVHDWNIINNDQKFNFVNKLYSNSKRLISLINNLLDLSKFEANKVEFQISKCNFITLIKKIIIECEALYAGKKNIVIKFEPENNIKFLVMADEQRIMQVMSNLISNAIKFTEKGIIKIEIKNYYINTIEMIEVSVIDNGIGIPENELEYIFGKFNQSTKTKTGAGGTGLGLSICREIIIAHNGKIWAENNKSNDGSTIRFYIPFSVIL